MRVLRQELRRVREEHVRRSSQAKEAYDALNAASHLNGSPLDGLRRHSRSESERFFARTVPGPDGHVFWEGGKDFRRNDGKYRKPLRWWWVHIHGEISAYDDVVATCGQVNCINPEHAAKGRHLARIRFSDGQMISAGRAAAREHGELPSQKRWDRLMLKPSSSLMCLRFGSWQKFADACGLVYIQSPHALTPGDCIRALRAAKAILGHWPKDGAELLTISAELEARGLTRRPPTIVKHLGKWEEALRKAADHREDEQAREGTVL
jgi:hypothetical protein